ncbi:hypothetical protein JHK82_052870 [Glycine max]|nr:hypothetical protein JHK82_052870 [Glycine max]
MPFPLSLCSSFPYVPSPSPLALPSPLPSPLTTTTPSPSSIPNHHEPPFSFLFCTSQDHYCTSLDDVAHSSMLGYGLTESAVTRITPEEANRVGATGKLIPSIEAKIVNPETGEAMFPGEQGELWIKGPYVMKGYAGDPKATSETLVDGWLRTGDLCYFDNEGFLYVVDRLKELIKYKGYLVAPAELEELLLSHPDINDAAVIP